MTVFYVILVIAIFIAVGYFIREIIKKYLVLDAGKYPVTLLIAIPIVMLIIGFCSAIYYKNVTYNAKEAANKVEEVTAESMCEENSVSYTLVQTISEYTEVPELDIAYIMKYCGKADMDLPDAIALCDSSLTENEIDAILVFSDHRQAQAEKVESIEAAEETPAEE